MNVLIRNVSEEKWRQFKAEAANRGLTVGELFNNIAEEYFDQSRVDEAWNAILNGEKTMTDEEAEDMMRAVQEFREGFKFDDPF